MLGEAWGEEGWGRIPHCKYLNNMPTTVLHSEGLDHKLEPSSSSLKTNQAATVRAARAAVQTSGAATRAAVGTATGGGVAIGCRGRLPTKVASCTVFAKSADPAGTGGSTTSNVCSRATFLWQKDKILFPILWEDLLSMSIYSVVFFSQELTDITQSESTNKRRASPHNRWEGEDEEVAQ